MSDQTADLLRQMANENVDIKGALQETPPQIRPSQMPNMDEMGLGAFRVHMSPNGYDTFMTIIHWAVLAQNLSDGKEVKWADETFAALSAGFVGFGNPLDWQATYSSNLGIIVHSHYLNWHGEGAKFRRENPLPHKLIREVAPLFANVNKGYQHMQMLRDLIADPKTYGQL